ncbi:2-phosphosulfolactate phosphatase [Nocardioides sp.]|uniref:2-phosphosulfolactate phosphatase n=1 Tax=Nocardioides sp. TaxID=35761 RepID=UPI002ED3347F
MVTAGHDQADHRIRLEWGPTGGTVIARRSGVAVVVDVLSFSTTVTVAVERGITVYPFRWRDERAAEYAEERRANLALQRHDARYRAGAVSLSPGSLQTATGIERLVLPSPNGSTICAELAGSGAEVVVACLRNARAVADWLRPRLDAGTVVAVVPAGERWPDGSMRPCAEDLWGAGAVLAELDPALMSPEARLARDAYARFEPRPLEHLSSCASGVELTAAGFAHDVAIAGRLHTSDAVPVLRGGAFAAVPRTVP